MNLNNNEVKLSESDVIISRADTKGIVTYINEAFTRVSGFTQDDIVGQPHNLVNHPDMPKVVFGDFWRTIKSNKQWQGVIKNKTKDGGYYWVKAYVTPIINNENEEPNEFSSVRVKPTEKEVENAKKIYDSIHNNENKYIIKEGNILKNSLYGAITNINPFTISNKIIGLNSIGTSIILGTISMGFLMSENTRNSIDSIQEIAQSKLPNLIALKESFNQEDFKTNKRILELTSSIDIKKNRLELIDSEKTLNNHFSQIKKLLDSNDLDAAKNYIKENRSPIEHNIQKVISNYQLEIQNISDDTETFQNYMRVLLLIAGLFGLLVLIVSSVSTIRTIRKPLKDAENNAIQVASGNLNTKNISFRNDELGTVLELINVMKKSLKSITSTTREGIDTIVPEIYDINNRNESMASRLEQQSSAVQETASSIEEISTTVRNTTENSNEAKNKSDTTLSKVNKTKEIIENLNASMSNVVKQSNEMQNLLKTIDTISFQTKILSINASIEGARAGEYGKGFSVVANEVRKLSIETENIAKNINTMLKKSSDAVSDAVEKTTLAIESINDVESETMEVNTFNNEISIVSQEQHMGIEEINRAITELDRTIQESAYDMKKHQSSIHNLKSRADEIAYNNKAFF